jgi:hypothetical protein
VLQAGDQPGDIVQIRIPQAGPWFGWVQRGRLAGAQFCQFEAEARQLLLESVASARRAGAAQQRQFERLGGLPEDALLGAELAQRVLQKRQQRRRLEVASGCLGRKPGENSPRRLHQRIAAGIVEGKIPAAKRCNHPLRQRAIRRHQRRRFVEMPRLAHRNRDRERFHFGIVGFDHGKVRRSKRNLCGDIGLGETPLPLLGGVRWPHRLGNQDVAPARRRFCQEFDVAAFDRKSLQQCVHGVLRMI